MNRMDQAIDQLSEEELDLLNSDPEMLAEFKAKYSDEPGMMERVADRLLPDRETLMAPMRASEKLGTMVKAGGSGIAELDKNLLPKFANKLPAVQIAQALGMVDKFKEEPFVPALNQASRNVENVMAGQKPETPVGRAGEFVGSFFTPNQIAMQATGAKVAPYIAKGLGALARPVLKGAVKAFPKVSELLGVAPEATARLIDNPGAVNAAKSMPEVADEVAGTIKGLSQKGMGAAEAGKKLLSAETVVPGIKEKLLAYAEEVGSGPLAEESDALAAKYVKEVAGKLKDKITEKEVGALIDTLDERIGAKWAKANPSVITEAKEEVRRILSRALQSQNTKYAKAMADSAATFEPTETLTKNLGLKKGAPSDSTIPALRKLTNPDALGTQRALSNFPGMSGSVADAAAKAALQETLLGQLSLGTAPMVGPLVEGAVNAIPTAGNAIYQGLRQ